MTDAFNIKPMEADDTTTMALANCGAIAIATVSMIGGGALSRTLNDSPLSQEAIAAMTVNRIVKNLLGRCQEARRTGALGL